jgi:hypothetical protein
VAPTCVVTSRWVGTLASSDESAMNFGDNPGPDRGYARTSEASGRVTHRAREKLSTMSWGEGGQGFLAISFLPGPYTSILRAKAPNRSVSRWFQCHGTQKGRGIFNTATREPPAKVMM